MLVVPVQEGESIERALKNYKRKFDSTKVSLQLRSRQQFTKPSVKKRVQNKKARYIQKLKDLEKI